MTKLNIKNISAFKDGDNINGFFYCRLADCKVTRLGDEYVDLILEDNSGTIRGKVWSYVDIFKSKFSKCMPVAIKGKIISYNNKLEINVLSINKANEELYKIYGFDQNQLIKRINENENKLYAELFDFINNLSSNYKKIISNIVKDNQIKVKSIPSIDKGYTLKGGFIKQVVSILRLNKKILPMYKKLNKDVVVSGIIIKNIGLVNYFNNDIQYSISEENEILDSRLLGINIVNDCCSKYSNFPQQIKTYLQNIILSENLYRDNQLNYINSLYKFDLSINLSNSEENIC